MADVNVALLVSQTVTEAQSQSRIKMGRNYASFYEAWAVLRQRIEETKRDAKALEKLHGELWDAIKDGNEDEALIELGAINAKFFSEFEIPPLSILQQQKIAELYLLAKKETALLRQLSAEKERYYDLLIRNVHSTMK